MSLPSGGVFNPGWLLVMLAALAGVLLDQVFGEASRWHPLIGFGHITAAIERCINRVSAALVRSRTIGLVAWAVAVLSFVLLVVWLVMMAGGVSPRLVVTPDAIALYFAIGARGLYEHIAPIALALRDVDLPRARALVSRIVSCDPTQAGDEPITRVVVESALENGSDVVFTPLFWLVVADVPGVMLYRLANTLDAMWGYRNVHFAGFGWVATCIDDVLNQTPVQLTVMNYTLLGHTADTPRCRRMQALQWSSPNAGPVMVADASSLCVRLGSAAHYEGVEEARPPLGTGKPATAVSTTRALTLVSHTLWLWLGILGLIVTSAWGLS